jgi:tRNA-splicing ligase RtcB
MQTFDSGIPVFGETDDHTLNQIRICARTADKVALMPHNHFGYGVPIGGVVACRDAISPTGVGFDIGCGNKTVQVDMPGSELRSPDKQSVGLRLFEDRDRHQMTRQP